MLPDPLAVTYDGVVNSLPRTSGLPLVRDKLIAHQSYNTAERTLDVKTSVSQFRDGRRFQISLGHASISGFPGNRVGLVFDVYDVNGEADITNLRSALLSLVDAALQQRLLDGEI